VQRPRHSAKPPCLPSAGSQTLGKPCVQVPRKCIFAECPVHDTRQSVFFLFFLFGDVCDTLSNIHYMHHIPSKLPSQDVHMGTSNPQIQLKFSIVHPQLEVVHKCKYKQTHTKASPYKYCTTTKQVHKYSTKQVHKYSLMWPLLPRRR